MLWLKVVKMPFGICIWSGVILIIVSILTATGSPDTCADLKSSSGVTYPRGDISRRVGENLTIYCKLNDKYMSQPNSKNSSYLTFAANDSYLPNEMIDIINSSTIRLHIENMTESFTYYHCKWKKNISDKDESNGKSVCLNNVAVGTPPKEVQNFSCVSLNWDNLTCTWRKPYNPIRTDYNLSFQLPGRASRGLNYNCPTKPEELDNNRYQCFWNISTVPRYRHVFHKFNFTMWGQNYLGSNVRIYNFNNFERIIFNRPLNLTCINKTTSSILIGWDLEGNVKTFPPGVKYKITYRSQYDLNTSDDDERNWKKVNPGNFPIKLDNKELKDRTQFNVNISGLKYSHAFYDIRVRVASAVASDEWWSQFSSVTVRTESKIPSYPPLVDIGSYEILTSANKRDIYIYWKTVPEYDHNGEDFQYVFRAFENNSYNSSLQPNETTASYAKFTDLRFGSYEFNIYSSNKIGRSVDYSKIIIPSFSDSVAEPSSFTKIAFDNHTYELSWKESVQPNNKTITSYTIFWCQNDKDRPYQCEGYLNFERVSASTRLLNKTVEDNSIYQFAISANTETSSSGMVWASCTIIYNRFVGKIKHVWVNKIGATFIEMGWKLDCSDRIGIVEGYRIFYCPIISPYNLSCNDSVQRNVTIKGDLNTISGVVENLRPYTTYRLSVSVLTKSGEGYASDDKYNTTLESAPDVIEDFEVTNRTNTTISLEWSKPKNMNGMFRYYRITYNNKQKIVENKGVENETLTNLTSFTKYNIKVSACTIACSDDSKPKSVMTLVGYPSAIGEPKVDYMNATQIKLYWSKPEIPGGDNLYQVKLEVVEGDKMKSITQNTTGLEMELMITCKSEYIYEQFYSVRAINQAEDGTVFVGPWSLSKKVQCNNSTTSYTIIYVLLALGLVVMICVTILGGRKVWIRYQEMKNVEVTLPPGLTHTIGTKIPEYSLTQRPVLSPGLQTSGMKPIKEILPNETLNSIASDEQLLLAKNKRGNIGEVDGTLISGESSGCSSGNESISSSIASVPISNIACNVSDSGTEHALSADTASLESGSLRWRNVSNKPHGSESTSNLRGDNTGRLPAWSKPYVTMPAQDNIDTFGGAWNKQTSPTGYCQVGTDSLTPVIPPQVQSTGTPGYVQVPTLSSIDTKPTSSSRGYVSYPKRPSEKLAISKPVFSSMLAHDPDDENTSVSQSDSDSSINESPNVQTTGFKYSPIGSPMKLSDLISIEPEEIEEDEREKQSDEVYSNLPTSSPYVKFGTEDSARPSSSPYVKVGREETKPAVPPYMKSADVDPSKKTAVSSSYVTLPQAIARQPSQKSQSSAADARPLLPSPPTAYSRVGVLEPGSASNMPVRSLPEYVQWKSPDSTSPETMPVKYDAEKLVPEKSTKQKSTYGSHRQFDCKLLKED